VIFKAILDETPTPATRLNPGLPLELERIIDKGLEKDRDLRYQGAAEMRSDLQRLKRDSESHRLSAVSAAPARRWPWIAGAALVLAAAAGAFFSFFIGTRRNSRKKTPSFWQISQTLPEILFLRARCVRASQRS